MYQVDNTKRYNLRVMQEGKYLNTTVDVENVSLVVVERGLVVVRDENGKEQIYTGDIGIYINEV